MTTRRTCSRGPERARLRARGWLCALGLVLAAAPAGAQLAGSQVANDVCRIESNRVNQLLAALTLAASDAGYTGGLSEEDCEKFVAQQVENCIAIVENGTDCRETLDRTEGKIQKAECTQEATKADKKSCERTAVLTQESNDQVANTLRVIGTNNCDGSFATSVMELCTDGPPP
jgi:hypothetical protein